MKNHFWLMIVTFSFLVGSGGYYHEQFKAVYTWNSGSDKEFSGELKLVSYNIRYGKGLDGQVNLNRTIATLKEINADIISLQEVERYSFRTNFFDQVQRLANELNMDVVFYPSLSYPGFYYGNVILSRFPIIETQALPLVSRNESRSALVAKIRLPQWDEVYIINTHLGLNKGERLEAIQFIYQFIGELEKPVFLTGDLNSTPKMNEYRAWDEYLQKSNEGSPIQTFAKEEWQIDYIFNSHHFIVENVTVFESNASDHYPVVGVFRFGNH